MREGSQAADILVAELFVDLEPEMSRLDVDVAVQFVLADPGKNVLVVLGRRFGSSRRSTNSPSMPLAAMKPSLFNECTTRTWSSSVSPAI